MAFRTIINSGAGKTFKPEVTIQWKLFKDEKGNIYDHLCCPAGHGPFDDKKGWLVCSNNDCVWSTDDWNWKYIFYTKMPTEEIKELVLDVVVCEEHSENENHSDDFGAYLDDRYEIIGGAVRKGSKSRSGFKRKSMKLEISTSKENYGRLRCYCLGSVAKQSCTHSVWLDSLSKNQHALFVGPLERWYENIDVTKYTDELLYRFESICKEVKFTKTVFWLCFDVMTGIKKMNKIEQKDMWANLFMKIIEQAVKRNTEVSTYHAITAKSISCLSYSDLGVSFFINSQIVKLNFFPYI
jgi:hypothetical protein